LTMGGETVRAKKITKENISSGKGKTPPHGRGPVEKTGPRLAQNAKKEKKVTRVKRILLWGDGK